MLVGSLMLIFSIFVGRAGHKFGLPSLLLFIAAGMMMGVDGLGIRFDNHSATQFVGILALCVHKFFLCRKPPACLDNVFYGFGLGICPVAFKAPGAKGKFEAAVGA